MSFQIIYTKVNNFMTLNLTFVLKKVFFTLLLPGHSYSKHIFLQL